MITAAEARKNVMDYCNDGIDERLAEISRKIERASKDGTTYILEYFFNPKICKMVVKACKKNGYKVTNSCCRCVISWD